MKENFKTLSQWVIWWSQITGCNTALYKKNQFSFFFKEMFSLYHVTPPYRKISSDGLIKLTCNKNYYNYEIFQWQFLVQGTTYLCIGNFFLLTLWVWSLPANMKIKNFTSKIYYPFYNRGWGKKSAQTVLSLEAIS